MTKTVAEVFDTIQRAENRTEPWRHLETRPEDMEIAGLMNVLSDCNILVELNEQQAATFQKYRHPSQRTTEPIPNLAGCLE